MSLESKSLESRVRNPESRAQSVIKASNTKIEPRVKGNSRLSTLDFLFRLDLNLQLLFQILFTNDRRLSRRARIIRDRVQFNNSPTMEFYFLQSSKHASRSTVPPSSVKPIDAVTVDAAYIVTSKSLMQKEQTIVVLAKFTGSPPPCW